MSGTLTVRRYCATEDADAGALRATFMSSVHGLADRSYTPAQLAAWAPQEVRQVAVRGQVLENARMGYHAPAQKIDLDS